MTQDLDPALIEALLAKYPVKIKISAIGSAIAFDLERDAADGLRRMAGKVEFEDRCGETRAAEVRSRPMAVHPYTFVSRIDRHVSGSGGTERSSKPRHHNE